MFLDRFKNKKRLGKGAYGDVYLVEDTKDGKNYALKLISIRMILEEPHLKQYLDGQIQCMKEMNSPNIIKLHEVKKDQEFYYFVLEFCEGGDLINYQAKLKDKVFNLSKATQVLAQVIEGLQALHQEQYLHRDIKSQNVLVKKQNGKEMFKLADFGFSKKEGDIGGTILGTEQFMSPEIYQGNEYGYEVDMWAFGVLFYFMLNIEYPFKLNPHWPPSKKQAELRKQAKQFSYTASVKNGKKKIMDNCTADMENIFKQIFEVEAKKRITFAQIRKHPIFAKYFPQVAQSSIILYSKRYKRKQVQPSYFLKKIKQEQKDDIIPVSRIVRKKKPKFAKESQAIERKKDEIDFLKENSEIFLTEATMLNKSVRYMLCFNIYKFYIILLKKFKSGMHNKNYLKDHFPELNWTQYIETDDFKKQVREVEDDLGKAEVKFEDLYQNCQALEKQISGINSSFMKAFRSQIIETDFVGQFKDSYRKSTIYVFGVLRELHKKSEKKGNKLNYLLCILLISNSFNNFFSEMENLKVILAEYFKQNNKNVDAIDYSELRDWLSRSKESILNEIAKNIVKAYFG